MSDKPTDNQNSVILPIYHTSTFCFPTAESGARAFEIAYGLDTLKEGESVPLIYTRVGNPNTLALEKRITKWDKAEDAVVFPSGMSAISTFCLSTLKPGDTMLSSDPIYGGAEHLFRHVLKGFGISCDFFPAGASKETVKGMLEKKKYKMVWVETPCNPLVKLTSIRAVADAIKETGTDAVLAVDNTFAGPLFHHPLQHGADVVVYSMTKFFGGHSDVTGGCCLGTKEAMSGVRGYRTILGAIPSPETCWLFCRSLETLELRMTKQCENAQKIVKFLSEHSEIKNLSYPGLSSNEEELACYRDEYKGPGSIFAFEVNGGRKAAFAVLNAVKVWHLAVSLGGVESLIEHPATMTHACMTSEELEHAGITQGLIRCSVGLENPEELINDLKEALENACLGELNNV